MVSDAEALREVAARALGASRLTRAQVVARTGIDRELAESLWQALGFPRQEEGAEAFTDDDARALQQAADLLAQGVVDARGLLRMSRQQGRALAGLAEAQVLGALEAGGRGALGDPQRLLELLEDLQRFIWRRHLLAAIERLAARPDPSSDAVAIGFTDLVSFTARSRQLSPGALDDLLDAFERDTQAVVVEGGGRVVKTLGDEVMWAADDPAVAARIALALASAEVRTGVAYGPTLARAGDHFGPTVNVASRLTALARPGTVLIDAGLDQALSGQATFHRRRLRPVAVRGYEHLRATVLRGSDRDGSAAAG